VSRASDVAVIGGGPAGCAAAITLARHGARVTLVDAPQRAQAGWVETLPPGARPLFRSLGMWDTLADGRQLPAYANESSWGSGAIARTDFIRDPNGHGWHVDRVLAQSAFRDVARQAGAEVIDGRVHRVLRTRAGWTVEADGPAGPSAIRAGRIVDASGRRALLPVSMGVKPSHTDRLVAIVAMLAPTGGHIDRDRLTFVSAAPDGWWFTAPSPAGGRALAYFTDASDPTARMAASSVGFTELWIRALHVSERVPHDRWTLASAPQVRAAGTTCLSACGGDGWVAAGDALMTFDPISSQGMLSAAYAGLRAAEALLADLAWDLALTRYREQTDAVRSAYREQWQQCYAMETRWPSRPFWARRRVQARRSTIHDAMSASLESSSAARSSADLALS
jgi:flavin-dependent dehydrogenase